MTLDQKFLILGLDSLPPKLTKELANNGTMPFLNELLKKGSFGPLRSITPANTGGAWNSAWTGLKPEAHGFFGFHHYDYIDDTTRISTSDRLKQPVVWDIMNQHGLKTLVINSPMQFPATPVDGVMVSGFMTPTGSASGTWPRDFQKIVTREIPDYNFDLRWQKDKDDDATFEANIASVITAFEQRVKVSQLAASQGDWDSLIIVFKSIDNMLHYTWDYLDEKCPLPKRRELVLQAFRALDDACRDLAKMAGYPKTNILVCSDHGHGGIKGHFYVNRWLEEKGLLVRQNKIGRFSSKLMSSFRKRLGIDKKKKKPSAYIGRRFTVEWEKSQAIMISSGVFYLNVQGRQPHGRVKPKDYETLRKNIAQQLESLTDDQGNKLIQHIYCPKEASSQALNPGESTIPDILFEPADGIVLKSTTTPGKIWVKGKINYLQGCHRIDGIILGAGPAFKEGQNVQGDLYDLGPTALAACNIPIPSELDGKPITELLADPNSVQYAEKSQVKQKTEHRDKNNPDHQNTNQDEQELTQRLSDLGYM